MEAMYTLSVQLHFGSVIFFLGVIAFNMAMVQFAVQPGEYVRRARIAMPFSVMTIAAIAFTGAIMMAAKHLDFTLENIAMIILAVALIGLEARRYKILRRLRTKQQDALALYRPYALKLLGAELVMNLLMMLWMTML